MQIDQGDGVARSAKYDGRNCSAETAANDDDVRSAQSFAHSVKKVTISIIGREKRVRHVARRVACKNLRIPFTLTVLPAGSPVAAVGGSFTN